MAFVHDDSCECVTSNLDLFSVPPTQTSVEFGTLVDYHPITNVADGGPIEFDIPGSGMDYLDLANTMLYVRAKITQRNGNDLGADTAVAPVNVFLHSLFSQVDMTLNGTVVTAANNMYPYRSYIETLLSYGSDAKRSQLTSELFYKDDAGRFDALEMDGANANSGFVKRNALIRASRSFDLIGRVHCDLMLQSRYLINEVNVKMKFVRSSDSFSLLCPNLQKVNIENAVLYVRKVKLSPSVFLAHAKALQTGTAKYPVRRVTCKSVTIPAGYYDVSHEKLFSGLLPNRIIVGLVRNDAFSGSRNHNPFNFQNFGLTEIAVYTDGQQHGQGIKPLKIDYTNSLYVRAYNTLFGGTGKLFHDEGNDISRSDYANGYALYAFDLSPDLTDDEHFDLSKTGSVRLQAKFADALATPVTLIAYAEFQNLLEIDNNRNVIYDFSG